MKQLLMTTIAIFGLATISMAQLPFYVPSNGLVGWWPFNGNANDESGYGNNGTTTNAFLTIDRFGSVNSAYSFDGNGDYIRIPNNNSLKLSGNFSISCWANSYDQNPFNSFLSKASNNQTSVSGWVFGYYNFLSPNKINFQGSPFFTNQTVSQSSTVIIDSTWNNVIVSYDSTASSLKYYLNGFLTDTFNISYNFINSNLDVFIGNHFTNNNPSQSVPSNGGFIGILDDIGIWNRVLTQEEISNLYTGSNCSNNLTITPETNQLQTGNTANFVATTSDSNPSYIWQSDFGQGFQTLNNYGNYSGVNTNSLSISNVQLPNHTQQVRVISTSGECIDTSNVATINIIDTCIVTINDTITTLISVTDTLVINTLITGLIPPNNLNTIKVFPNPANSHITIDFGNFASMNGYILNITNSIGQIVYTTSINQQSSYVDLSTWGGNGIYLVQIIDAQNNTIENRKIVLQ